MCITGCVVTRWVGARAGEAGRCLGAASPCCAWWLRRDGGSSVHVCKRARVLDGVGRRWQECVPEFQEVGARGPPQPRNCAYLCNPRASACEPRPCMPWQHTLPFGGSRGLVFAQAPLFEYNSRTTGVLPALHLVRVQALCTQPPCPRPLASYRLTPALPSSAPTPLTSLKARMRPFHPPSALSAEAMNLLNFLSAGISTCR